MNDVTHNKTLLFVLGAWTVGGVERVTVVMANELARRGWRVYISAYEIRNRMLFKELDSCVTVLNLQEGWLTSANQKIISNLIKKEGVSIVVNQWCVSCRATKFIKKAISGTRAKLISFHHSRPDINNRIMSSRQVVIREIFRLLTRISLRFVYAWSDAYVVLSPSFIEVFRRFTHIQRASRVCAIPNPLTIKRLSEDQPEKENLIIYVGRLEETQKRVSRILDVWGRVYAVLPQWKLKIVGDGPDKELYLSRAKDMRNVDFVGFCDPQEYYARAKLLLMTSDYEGFPLVLAEAMSFGCIPIALKSFASLEDVIRDDRCGVVVPAPFKPDVFATVIMDLATDAGRLSRMLVHAQETAKTYSVEKVADQYEQCFARILKPSSLGGLEGVRAGSRGFV